MTIYQRSRRLIRAVRLTATLAAIAGLVLIVAEYLAGGICSPLATALVGGALVTHYVIRPENRNGRAA